MSISIKIKVFAHPLSFAFGNHTHREYYVVYWMSIENLEMATQTLWSQVIAGLSTLLIQFDWQ